MRGLPVTPTGLRIPVMIDLQRKFRYDEYINDIEI